MGRGRFVKRGSPDYQAMIANNQADDLRKAGNYAEAEPLYMKALAIWEEEFGKDSEPVATCCGSIGIMLAAKGDFDRAANYIERACEIETDPMALQAHKTVLEVLQVGSMQQLVSLRQAAKAW